MPKFTNTKEIVGFLSFSSFFLLLCIFVYPFKTAIVLILVLNKINIFQKAEKTTTATCDKEKANVLICSYHHWLLYDYQA